MARIGDDVDKLAEAHWHPGPGGVRLLYDLPRRLVGQVLERLPHRRVSAVPAYLRG